MSHILKRVVPSGSQGLYFDKYISTSINDFARPCGIDTKGVMNRYVDLKYIASSGLLVGFSNNSLAAQKILHYCFIHSEGNCGGLSSINMTSVRNRVCIPLC